MRKAACTYACGRQDAHRRRHTCWHTHRKLRRCVLYVRNMLFCADSPVRWAGECSRLSRLSASWALLQFHKPGHCNIGCRRPSSVFDYQFLKLAEAGAGTQDSQWNRSSVQKRFLAAGLLTTLLDLSTRLSDPKTPAYDADFRLNSPATQDYILENTSLLRPDSGRWLAS